MEFTSRPQKRMVAAVVYYDGVEGPKFDEIFPLSNSGTGSRMAFSPDGNHYALRALRQSIGGDGGRQRACAQHRYASRKVCMDKCQARLHIEQHASFYVAQMHETQPIDQTVSRFVFDGKADMPSANIDNFVLSPDGNHYAYIRNDPDRRRPWMLIVDGKPATYQAGAPQWTSDSKHLYTQKRSAAGTDLLFDGKPVMRANGFVVYIPPVGDMLVVAVTVATNGVSRSFLVLNGKKVPGSDTVERGS